METEILLCECNSVEHQVLFIHFEHEDSVYVKIHLNSTSFWKRLKYLFGYKSRFGAFDEVIVPRKKFQEMTEKLSTN